MNDRPDMKDREGYKWSVQSCSLDLTKPRRPATPDGSLVHTEVIDTKENVLFAECCSPWQVADRYEAFWNRLNPSDEQRPGNCSNPRGRVVVLNVTAIDETPSSVTTRFEDVKRRSAAAVAGHKTRTAKPGAERVRRSRAVRGQVRRMANKMLAVERYDYPSGSRADVTYHTAIDVDGKLRCDCRGWIMRKTDRLTGTKLPRECEHTRKAAALRPTTTRGEFLYLDRTVTR